MWKPTTQSHFSTIEAFTIQTCCLDIDVVYAHATHRGGNWPGSAWLGLRQTHEEIEVQPWAYKSHGSAVTVGWGGRKKNVNWWGKRALSFFKGAGCLTALMVKSFQAIWLLDVSPGPSNWGFLSSFCDRPCRFLIGKAGSELRHIQNNYKAPQMDEVTHMSVGQGKGVCFLGQTRGQEASVIAGVCFDCQDLPCICSETRKSLKKMANSGGFEGRTLDIKLPGV